MFKVYQVLKKFDLKKNYGLDIRPQYAKCLTIIKKGDKINSKEFAINHGGEFTSRRNTLDASLAVTYKAISTGTKIGILEEIPHETIPILVMIFVN